MNLLRTLTILFLLTIPILSQTDEFRTPWKDPHRALILDPYHKNDLDFDKLQTFPQVVAIIHKASECIWNSQLQRCDRMLYDTKYHERKAEALKRGYLWGSYHFGRNGIPAREQADAYFKNVNPGENELIALDVDGEGVKNMSLKNAEIFINRIRELTGRYPLLYTTGGVAAKIVGDPQRFKIFTNTPLWYVRACNDISCYFGDPHRTIWPTYTIWQFASELNCRSDAIRPVKPCKIGGKCPTNTCPIRVPGTPKEMDVNVYNGTVEELRRKWPLTYREGSAQ